MSTPVGTSAVPACSDPLSLAQARQGDSNTLVSPSPSPPPIRPTPGSIWLALYSKRSKIFGLGREQKPSGTSVARAGPRFGQSPAGIFRFGKNQMEGGADAVEPKLDEKHLVSLFWHADEQLLRNVHRLREVHQFAHLVTRLHRRTDMVHKSQKILLDALHLIAEQVHHDLVQAGDEGLFASRSHRKTLPLDDQRELELGYSENILFAAQALSSGFRIRGLDANSPTLTQPAQQLIASLEAVRWVLRRRAVVDPYPPYEAEEIIAVLRDFDAACIMYMSRTGQNDVDMFAILMSETLVKAVQRGHLHPTQISELDPLIFLALPRLTVVAGLLHFPNLVDLIHPETCIRWFRHKCSRLRELQWELEGLEDREVVVLEKLLTDGNDDLISPSDQKSTTKTPSPRVQRLFTDVCAIADDLQSGAKAREFVQVLNKVLVMHKSDECAKPPKDVDAGTGEATQQVALGGGPKRKWWRPSRRGAGSSVGASSRAQVQDQTSVTGSS
ncbi:hypothetical protein M427DRAFT_35651 [Gonapodya prolifera JEL478]|uniref:Uncharacterized protein n=1 Tax=Gonapodya prolifera (strain JEL478) TaxID=1344416 RepID=A0A139A3W7_GONPJ|nr:hypothetical protein M427DRAFT_35651 [Gonapodya prolifera JEL478]|eukprot:KXS11517.1 hypothetical protein M427DRAFT_35651 [Gonapodya prolifera JEL478]